ncbi:hypothetical protein KR222_010381, partial [Zaprionus bogoriensis]
STRVARLEQEINLLRQELALVKLDRQELYRKHGGHLKRCEGGDCCRANSCSGAAARNQELYISFLEEQIKQTRQKYQRQIGDVKQSASALEEKLRCVHQEMACITAKAQQVSKLQKCIEALKSKLERRDITIARFNQQYTTFMHVMRRSLEQRERAELRPQLKQSIVS